MIAKIIRILKYSGLGLLGLFLLLGIIGASGGLDQNEETVESQMLITQEEDVEETSIPEPDVIVEEVPESVAEIESESIPVVQEKAPTIQPVVVPLVTIPDPIPEPVVIEVEEELEPVVIQEEIETSSGPRYYTSSHYSAKYYYPEDCTAWEDLSPSYLRSFNSLEALLSAHHRTLNPEC